MIAPDVDAIAARYSAALNAKPSKGEWTQRGIDALTDSVSDVGELLALVAEQVAALDDAEGQVERWRTYRDAEFERLGVALAERDRLAAQVQAVRALHHSREHQAGDFVAFGQTEFPPVCAFDREEFPCTTIAALDTGKERP